MASQPLLDFGNERLEKLDATHAAVFGSDDVPGGIGAIGELEKLVDDGQRLVVVLVLVKILFVNAPCGRLVCLKGLEALGLFLLADVEEQLDDEIAIGDELALENPGGLGEETCLAVTRLHDVINVIANLGLRQMRGPLAAMNHAGEVFDDLGIPALVEERHGAVLANALPEALHERIAALFFRGVVHRVHGERASVEVLHQFGDTRALARCAPAVHADDDGELLADALLLQAHELLGELPLALLVFFLIDAFLEIGLLEHVLPLRLGITLYRLPPSQRHHKKKPGLRNGIRVFRELAKGQEVT